MLGGKLEVAIGLGLASMGAICWVENLKLLLGLD